MTYGEALLGFVAYGVGIFLFALIWIAMERRRKTAQKSLRSPPEKKSSPSEADLATAHDRR